MFLFLVQYLLDFSQCSSMVAKSQWKKSKMVFESFNCNEQLACHIEVTAK